MSPAKPEIIITYCTQCQWLLRAAWLAQELLSTLPTTWGGCPGARERRDLPHQLRRRADLGAQARRRLPEAKELKQRVRDRIDPQRSLGHNDR